MLKIVKKPAPVETKAAEPEKVAEPVAGKTSKGTVKESVEGLAMLPPMCTVSLEVGYSHKLPSEDWIKVGVRLDVPAKYEDIDKVFDYAKEWTDAKLNAAVAEITGTGE